MKKENGFTLIELLAVIVILAVIALIATPIIMNVINDAKEGAFKDSAYGVIKAAELKVANSIMNGKAPIQTSFDLTTDDLNYKGTKPKAGMLTMNAKGQIFLEMNDGTWCAKKDYNDSDITITKKTTACDGKESSDEVSVTIKAVDVNGDPLSGVNIIIRGIEGSITTRRDGTAMVQLKTGVYFLEANLINYDTTVESFAIYEPDTTFIFIMRSAGGSGGGGGGGTAPTPAPTPVTPSSSPGIPVPTNGPSAGTEI